jgi:hypothetical protein
VSSGIVKTAISAADNATQTFRDLMLSSFFESPAVDPDATKLGKSTCPRRRV